MALAILAGLVVYPAVATHRFGGAIVAVGVAGWIVLVLGLTLRVSWLVAWALVLFGTEYAAFVRLRGGAVDARSMYVAAGLVVVAELAFASIQIRVPSADRALTVRRLVALVAAAVGAAFAGALVLVASGSAHGGVGAEAFGAVAAVLAVAAIVRVASRSRDSTST